MSSFSVTPVVLKAGIAQDRTIAAPDFVQSISTYAERMPDASADTMVFFDHLKMQLTDILKAYDVCVPSDVKIIDTDALVLNDLTPIIPRRQLAFGPEEFKKRTFREDTKSIGVLLYPYTEAENDSLRFHRFLKIKVGLETRALSVSIVVSPGFIITSSALE